MRYGTDMNNKKGRVIINILIAALVLIAIFISVLRSGGGLLAAKGFENMKFFTTQSNVFRGIVAVFIAVSSLRGQDKGNRALAMWDYVSTCTVAVTFTVVFAFFGPLYGYMNMLRNANFFFHLVIPVLSMLEFVIFNDVRIKMPKLLLAAVPPLLYGVFYYLNLKINGIGTWPDTNDWYGFVNWGFGVGFVIFGAICVVSVLAGWLLTIINRRTKPSHPGEGVS